ncbi:TIR domain-containing protein [Fusobacterium necrophorum]|uniref:TIR domain-containing protein n=1 Tax=Fusobacterium necrophorum TaxID=859 RepID=UPI003D6E8BC9
MLLDDIGKVKNELGDSLKNKQNIVFEAGYFVRKLGKQNVVLSSDENIELLSDFQGVVYSNESE